MRERFAELVGCLLANADGSLSETQVERFLVLRVRIECVVPFYFMCTWPGDLLPCPHPNLYGTAASAPLARMNASFHVRIFVHDDHLR